jgi:hypothetical protein
MTMRRRRRRRKTTTKTSSHGFHIVVPVLVQKTLQKLPQKLQPRKHAAQRNLRFKPGKAPM